MPLVTVLEEIFLHSRSWVYRWKFTLIHTPPTVQGLCRHLKKPLSHGVNPWSYWLFWGWYFGRILSWHSVDCML